MYAILDEVTYMTLKTESSISLKFRLHTRLSKKLMDVDLICFVCPAKITIFNK
jgi:hypothetical protein